MYKYGIIETEARGKQNRDVILTWLFEENGTLSIFGAGMLPDYKDGQDRPWQEFADQVSAVVIDDGITAVGARTFAGYEKLESVKLPDSMSRIGFRAFADCPKLKTVTANKPIAHAYSTNVASAASNKLTNLFIITLLLTASPPYPARPAPGFQYLFLVQHRFLHHSADPQLHF